MRLLLIPLTCVALAAPAAAQSDAGRLPPGWHARTDRAGEALSGIRFSAEGGALHVRTGPAAILWNGGNNARGNFTASATFAATRQPPREAYGLVFGGRSLQGENPEYGYFIIRGDGSFMIRHRAGAELHTLQAWTKHAAVRTPDAQGLMRNTLSIEAGAATVRFLVNGTEVASYPREAPMEPNGFVGLRVNHHLDVQVENFGVQTR